MYNKIGDSVNDVVFNFSLPPSAYSAVNFFAASNCNQIVSTSYVFVAMFYVFIISILMIIAGDLI